MSALDCFVFAVLIDSLWNSPIRLLDNLSSVPSAHIVIAPLPTI